MTLNMAGGMTEAPNTAGGVTEKCQETENITNPFKGLFLSHFRVTSRVGQKIKIFDLGFPIRRAFAEWC